LQFIATAKPGCIAARTPHRAHIFRYDVADRVAFIIRLRRSIAHMRERTQCFDYFPNPFLATAAKLMIVTVSNAVG